MQIIKLNVVDSTHIYLKNYLKEHSYTKPLCIVSQYQTKGIGSRGNEWIGKKGNLFFSFVIDKSLLPLDLPLQSASIYFSYILKSCLKEMGSNIWLKWPNDFYIDDKKIGGTITSLNKDLFMCGIGLNLLKVDKMFGKLDINIDADELLKYYFKNLEKRPKWKQIFSEYQIEYKKSFEFKATINDEKISLKNAILNPDGSICINNQKVYSLR